MYCYSRWSSELDQHGCLCVFMTLTFLMIIFLVDFCWSSQGWWHKDQWSERTTKQHTRDSLPRCFNKEGQLCQCKWPDSIWVIFLVFVFFWFVSFCLGFLLTFDLNIKFSDVCSADAWYINFYFPREPWAQLMLLLNVRFYALYLLTFLYNDAGKYLLN